MKQYPITGSGALSRRGRFPHHAVAGSREKRRIAWRRSLPRRVAIRRTATIRRGAALGKVGERCETRPKRKTVCCEKTYKKAVARHEAPLGRQAARRRVALGRAVICRSEIVRRKVTTRHDTVDDVFPLRRRFPRNGRRRTVQMNSFHGRGNSARQPFVARKARGRLGRRRDKRLGLNRSSREADFGFLSEGSEGGESGMVTSEVAIGSLVLAFVTALALALGHVAVTYLEANDAARMAARMASLGESQAEIKQAVDRSFPGASVNVVSGGNTVEAVVYAPRTGMSGKLGVEVRASVIASVEPGAGAEIDNLGGQSGSSGVGEP